MIPIGRSTPRIVLRHIAYLFTWPSLGWNGKLGAIDRVYGICFGVARGRIVPNERAGGGAIHVIAPRLARVDRRFGGGVPRDVEHRKCRVYGISLLARAPKLSKLTGIGAQLCAREA